MANGKISGDPIATTAVGVYMAGIQGGANVQAPSTLFAANQFNLSDLSNPGQALLNLGGLSSALAASTYLTQVDAASTYLTIAAAGSGFQPLNANLTSWAAITRAAGFDAFAATPSSANLKTLVTDETGSGALVFATSPTLVTPALGTPTALVLTNATGLPITGITSSTSAQVAALVSDETGSGSLVFANTPTLVTPNIGAATGLSATLQTTGTGSSGLARYSFNRMTVSADDVDMGAVAKKVDGLEVNHLFGGAATRGGRHGIEAFCTLTAATSATNPDRNYVGGAFTGWALTDDGGGVGTEKGGIFGINAQGVLANTATNFNNVSGGEINVAINTGASAKYKSGLQVVGRSDDAVKGSTYDTLLALSNQGSTIKFDNGILVGPMNGFHPVDTTGTIFGTVGASTVANGIDFSSYTISGGFLKGPNGFTVTGSGTQSMTASSASIEMGNPLAVNTPFIDFHSSGNANDYDVRLLASGGAAGDGAGSLTLTGSFAVSAVAQAASFRPTGSTVPTNGLYLPAANTLGWGISGAAKLQLTTAALSPAVNDGAALGTATLSYADLFLASGAVINFANGNYTITHSTGALTFSGVTVFSGAVAIASSFIVGAGPVTKNADFTLGAAESSIIVTKGSSCTATLGAPTAGRRISIKTTVAFTTVSASSNVVPRAGGAAGTAILAGVAGSWADLEYDGTNWVIMAGA